MFASQLRPGDVIRHTEAQRLRACGRRAKRTRRWRFVSYARSGGFGGWFERLVVTDERGRGEFGLCERDGFDWKVEGDPCRKWSCGSEAPHTYAGCLDYHMAKGAA